MFHFLVRLAVLNSLFAPCFQDQVARREGVANRLPRLHEADEDEYIPGGALSSPLQIRPRASELDEDDYIPEYVPGSLVQVGSSSVREFSI